MCIIVVYGSGWVLLRIIPGLARWESVSQLGVAAGLSASFIAILGLGGSLAESPYAIRATVLVSSTLPIFGLLKMRDRVSLSFPISRRRAAFLLLSILVLLSYLAGIYSLNMTETPGLSAVMPVLLAIYIGCAYYWGAEDISIYAICLFVVSLSLIYSNSLRSPNLLGWDVYGEKFVADRTASAGFWRIEDYENSALSFYQSSLPTTIVNNVYKIALGSDITLVFRLVLPLIFSSIPVICYAVFSRFLGQRNSFLSSLFLCLQFPFVSMLHQVSRQGYALLFSSMLMLWIWIPPSRGKSAFPLLAILSSMIVFSHYSSGYLLLFIFGLALVIGKIAETGSNGRSGRRWPHNAIGVAVCILLVTLYFWLDLFLGGKGFIHASNVVDSALSSIQGTLPQPNLIKTLGAQQMSLPRLMTYVWAVVGFVSVAVGVIISIASRRRVPRTFLFISFPALVSLFLMFVPTFTEAYDLSRVYINVIILLLPFLTIGFFGFLGKMGLRSSKCSFMILAYLMVQLLLVSGFISHILGERRYLTVDSYTESIVYGEMGDLFVFDSEIAAALFLGSEMKPDEIVRDSPSIVRLWLSGIQNSRCLFPGSNIDHATVYLRWVNVKFGRYRSRTGPEGIEVFLDHSSVRFVSPTKVYNSGKAEIIICEELLVDSDFTESTIERGVRHN
jgi:uncharacterized membrane protein